MFLRAKFNPIYTFSKGQYFALLSCDNLAQVTKKKLKKYEKQIGTEDSWRQHKWLVLWTWINRNFEISERFINRVGHYIKKLNLKPTVKEERFLYAIKGLYFATWRPLKELVVRFEVDKKETVLFYESEGNLYQVKKDDKNGFNSPKKMVAGDLYFSNKRIFICDHRQKVLETLSLQDIIDVQIEETGTILKTEKELFLVRSQNRFMTYIVLQRLIPRLKLNINKVPNLYNYFDFWNKVLIRFY